MAKKIKVFISHRRNNGVASPEAKAIQEELEKAGFDVFLDELRLNTGDEWAKEIFDQLHSSDVLIVLLQKETYKSDWIQREVDMARSLFLRRLPLLVEDIPKADLEVATKRLDLDHIQFTRFTGTDTEYRQLESNIRRSVVKAKAEQADWIKQRHAHWQLEKAKDQLIVASYDLPNYPNRCLVHIASGDLTKLSVTNGHAFDVIVNSENNHMQMARIFEGNRLSSNLRRRGALYHPKRGSLVDDTLQRELDIQVIYNKEFERPIEDCQVIPTYAGHPRSRLVRQTGARYIFHATTVKVDGLMEARDSAEPIINSAERMELVVHNVLRQVINVDDNHGQIFPEALFEGAGAGPDILFKQDSAQWERRIADQNHYVPITSIIFPLLGTGHANLDAANVVNWIVDALWSFPMDAANEANRLQLTDIFICAYSEDHVQLLKDALDRVSAASTP